MIYFKEKITRQLLHAISSIVSNNRLRVFYDLTYIVIRAASKKSLNKTLCLKDNHSTLSDLFHVY